ncbi:MAG TPA: hypothetical protein VHT52_04220 [Stellaceae bacterium]|jgi:hypothetical protein|nr:hypothetical protein [Stellaceae bacterium]
MRVDTDTYVWDVAKIIIERKAEADGSVTIRLSAADDESALAGASLYVWGAGKHGERSTPAIVMIENGVERVLVEGAPAPKSSESGK